MHLIKKQIKVFWIIFQSRLQFISYPLIWKIINHYNNTITILDDKFWNANFPYIQRIKYESHHNLQSLISFNNTNSPNSKLLPLYIPLSKCRTAVQSIKYFESQSKRTVPPQIRQFVFNNGFKIFAFESFQ